MPWVRAALGVSTLAFLAAALHAQAPAAAPRTTYLGSQACQRCHQSSYDTWRRTLHVQMTKPIAEARVEGEFGTAAAPVTVNQNGRSYAMENRGGKYFVSVARTNRPAEKFEVHYTLGARRFQGYLSKLADGRIYVLPVFWHNEAKRWVDWKEITPIPDDPDHDLRQIWNVTCVNCHATNLVKNFSPATNSYATTWTEMGIGCEACHGPGSAHVAVTTEWEKTPASKPSDPTPADLQIFSPERATPRQVFDTCGYCHGNKNNVFFGFKPGDRYTDYALPFLVSQPIPGNDPQGDFWPDGRPSRFNRPQALALSGCFQKGEATCINCHRMHGSQNTHSLKVQVEAPDGGLTVQSDTLCTQCHKRLKPEHTHHAVDSQGSRCIACHMSDVNWRLITRRRDHTFQPPVPELTSRFGVPNACTACHEDKPPEWAVTIMDDWYHNGDRRRGIVATADIMYRAGAGEAEVRPDVARLAVNRSQAPLFRASAAEFAGQLIEQLKGKSHPDQAENRTPAVVSPVVMNALIGAAADPDPLVRITALRSLSLIVEPRVPPVLAAHLTDEVRLVRVSAAEALTTQGVVQLPGPAGDALARALDEWSESLRAFNDVAADHTTLGWLEAQRGRHNEAEKSLKTAIALDPTDARPHVYLGVLAAREGRFDDAIRHFKAAKSISPSYQNLDLLLSEASRRATKEH
ncbi:MAG TPA: multiheme c-type cytochrome [Vicinamibacterales bacterium]|nr:multiheme c-type cytochrome [Vicinamibacterales bacterium]